MSGRSKRRRDDDDFINDNSDEETGGKKKGMRKNYRKDENRGDTQRAEDGITACMISNTRKVVVKQFKSMILIDIRNYYGNEDDLKPTKKGISLTLDQWKLLCESIDEVDEAIQEMAES